MKHLSVFRRWTSTARQLWLALLGLVLLFVTLVFSTLDFTLQLNRYTIASSQDSLQNTARSSIAALDSAFDGQSGYSAVYNSPSTRTTGSMCMCRCG